MKAAIIGGGIGGLAAAVAFRRVGIDCEVFEQADELREIGAGLTVWSNAVVALRKLGVAESLWAAGSKLDEMQVRARNGRVLSRTPLFEMERLYGIPGNICLHRADLLRELARHLEAKSVHCGARLSTAQEKDGIVTARFCNNSEIKADFLVGADGLHSVVRTHLHGPGEPRYAGYTCWRGVVRFAPAGLAPNSGFECWGRGSRFAALPCGVGRIFWWATQNCPQGERDGPKGRKSDVLKVFEGWSQPIPEIVRATPEEAMIRNDIMDRPPIRGWGRGRITLLGDAAHPTTPNLGQGACQALEDAVVIADCLRRSPSIEAGLRTYEQRRQSHTARITNESWRFGQIGQWENPLACRARDLSAQLFPAVASLRLMRRFLECNLPNLSAEPGVSE